MRRLCNRLRVPLVLAGDVFHRWKTSPEVVNRAIFDLRMFRHGVYAVPGQHDLPHHRYDEIKKSSFWTLVNARAVIDLRPDQCQYVGSRVFLNAFPWGFPIRKPALTTWHEDGGPGSLSVAVVHSYVWQEGRCYPGAPADKHVSAYADSLKGYDAVVFGDNHRGFLAHVGGRPVFNCGTLIRHNSDEKEYRPHVGILFSDGTIKRHYLDTSKDRWHTESKADRVSDELEAEEFLAELQDLDGVILDFTEAVTRHMDKMKSLSKGVRKIILSALEVK